MIRMIFLFGIIAFAANACGDDSNIPTPEQLQRMNLVRGHLKETLGDQYDLPVAAATEDQLKRGQELYQQVCAPCHGVRGNGDGHTAEGLLGRPTDLTDPAQATFYSEQARLHIIRKGVQGTPMMSWGNVLTEADILAVYVYVRSMIKRK
jgi:high-affinity iron transporter